MNRYSDRALRDRIAEEAQLLCEEKWIIEALALIKQQKNCLQIERLQLESIESRLRQKQNKTTRYSPSSEEALATEPREENPLNSTAGSLRNRIEFEVPLTNDEAAVQTVDLDTCNDEELDLTVSLSVFSQEVRENIMEEYEEDEENIVVDMEDDEDEENIVVDMDMFMNAENSERKP